MLNLLILSSFFLASWCWSKPLQLNEKLLADFAAKGSPRLEQIESALLSATLSEQETKDKYSPELFGRASYLETNERAIIRFIPVWSPVSQARFGVRQKLKHGLSASAAVMTDQRNALSPIGSYRNITTTTLSFTMQMDLWKDLFGRLSKAKLESAELQKRRAEIEREIQTKAFQISLRRLFWSIVANQESISISEELLKTAKRQASDAALRLRNSVAEADELARYEAQVANREGAILYLKYQREGYLKQLKNLLPELMNQELELGAYDLDRTLDTVLACTATIARESAVPLNFTRYDEAIALLRKIRAQASAINERSDGPDVQLFGTLQSRGVGANELPSVVTGVTNSRGSFGDSISDLTENNRSGYEVGLQFTVPLGESKKRIKNTRELYDEKRLSAAIAETEAQVESTHRQLVKSVAILGDVIRAQKTNSAQLNKRLGLMQKKYQQARVSVNELIMDQDALFNSRLTTIDTQLQVLYTLFDYLVIYTETPCEFNRI